MFNTFTKSINSPLKYWPTSGIFWLNGYATSFLKIQVVPFIDVPPPLPIANPSPVV